jgi:hypothetical protein
MNKSVKVNELTYKMLSEMSKKSNIKIELFLEALTKKEYLSRK